MHLPQRVRAIVEEFAGRVPFGALVRAVPELSDHYRSRQDTSRLRLVPAEKVAAYLITRLPATYAASHRVFNELQGRVPWCTPESLLDVGAGLGAAALAASEIFDSLSAVTLLESDGAFREAAERILPMAKWQPANVAQCAEFAPHDLVVASYSLGELSNSERAAVVERAWKAARMAVVLIEPGSPAGFAVIRESRGWLLSRGGEMVAPCPGSGPCPLPANDWCHFAARLERSALHRRLKQAQLSYEDEKFSYVVAAKRDATRAAARVIRRPVHHPGMIQLTVCRGDHVAEERVTKRDKDRFRQARKAEWGDEWNAQRP